MCVCGFGGKLGISLPTTVFESGGVSAVRTCRYIYILWRHRIDDTLQVIHVHIESYVRTYVLAPKASKHLIS